jgi:hypothetical protein
MPTLTRTTALPADLCGWCDRDATVATGTDDASCARHTPETYALTRLLDDYAGALPSPGARSRGLTLTARLTLARLDRKARA